jgi:hypothetical protein
MLLAEQNVTIRPCSRALACCRFSHSNPNFEKNRKSLSLLAYIYLSLPPEVERLNYMP